MTVPNINTQLHEQALTVLDNLGLDMTSVINNLLAHIISEKTVPFEVTEELHEPVQPKFGGWEGKIWMSDDFNEPLELVPERRKRTRAEMFGCMRGQISVPDDFDEPLADFEEYM